MLTWLLGGLAVVTLIAWRVIASAEADDKQRKLSKRSR
jgi:hypothetical protein